MFKNWLTKLPFPIAGLMLGLAALGNGLAIYDQRLRWACGIVSMLIFALLVIKILILSQTIVQAFAMPPVASVLACFPMGMMVLATYFKTFNPIFGTFIWWSGFIIDVVIILVFTLKHALPFKLEKLFAGYFVTYVGIVVASVTAKAFAQEALGQAAFTFGLVAYTILLPLVTISYRKKTALKEPLKPLLAIYGAPANLLVAGYMSLGLTWSAQLLQVLYILGLLTTVFAWYQVFKTARGAFYPSFAAYTFPLAIGVVATNLFRQTLATDTFAAGLIQGFAYVQTFVAILVIGYVLIRYIRNSLVINTTKTSSL